MEKLDYQKTLQLPKTDFPMRASLPKREPEMLQHWQKKEFYAQLQSLGKELGLPDYILHDGPPYANGHIHMGTALNKVLKDLVIRSRSMEGYRVPYVPGWDTHGLPIELRAIKDLGKERADTADSILELRKRCREYALHYLDIQREEFKRLGIWGDWDNPYVTLAPEYEAKQIEIFGKMAEKGYITRALKPVYWCADCATALAEAEIEYEERRSPSIYVRFAVKDGKGILPEKDTYFVIWTTTPWTIPANLGICLNAHLDYVVIETNIGNLVVAKGLLEDFASKVELDDYKVIAEFKGDQLENIVCSHPLYERESIVILGDHATLEAGTGCVHTAPGHGQEDYAVGIKYGLDVFAPVDANGVFTEAAGRYQGIQIFDANKIICDDLEEAGALIKLDFVEHSYPHCWRCKKPVFFRGTEQLFASISGFRQVMLDEIDEVQWIPSWGADRITNMVKDRQDWCISRQRIWGVPIPLFYCEGCGEAIINEQTTEQVASIFRKEGSDAWWAKSVKELLPKDFVCPKCENTSFTKEKDIMDVWFDSGVSHAAVLQQREELSWPADLYLEGSDQHRGWFQSSLSTSAAAYNQAPFKSVLTHGFVVDGEGKKMSKSLGNVMEPAKIIQRYGADILRMWVASSEYRADIRVSQDILKQLSDAYRRIRNTARFILGNISDFNPSVDGIRYENLTDIDQWVLHNLFVLSENVRQAYNKFEFHTVYHRIYQFCSVDLGGFYLDVLKDRLYCDSPAGVNRRSSQTAMHLVLVELVKLLAPMMVFTADEIWQYLPEANNIESVHLARWEQLPDVYYNVAIEKKWASVLEVRHLVTKALEEARGNKRLGSSNDATVTIIGDRESIDKLQPFADSLAMLYIVSDVRLITKDRVGEISVEVELAETEKCERCWRRVDNIIEKEQGHICKRCHTVINSSTE